MKHVAKVMLGSIAAAGGSSLVYTLIAARKSPVPNAALVRPMFSLGVADHGPFEKEVVGRLLEERLTITPSDLPAFEVEFYRPSDSEGAPWPVVVYVHGGGFIGGSTGQIRAYCEVLASQGYVVANVDYTLAPELKFPGAIRQIIELIRRLPSLAPERNGDPARVVIAGDSAGAHIAASVAAAITNRNYAKRLGEDLPGDGTVPGTVYPSTHVRAALLFCGPYDISSPKDILFPGVNIYMFAYTGERDWQSWDRVEELAPNRWATAAFPPTFLTVGDADPLVKQSVLMERALKAVGVQTQSLYWKRRFLPHEYQRELHRPEAQKALEQTLEFLRMHVGQLRPDELTDQRH